MRWLCRGAIASALIFASATLPAIVSGGALAQSDRNLGGATPETDANPEAVRADYELAERIGSAAAWRAFLAKHPTGFYADLARSQLEKLGVAAPPAPSSPPTQAEPGRSLQDLFSPKPPDSARPAPAPPGTPPSQSVIKVTPLSPQDERALNPKDTFKECNVCPEMIVVPAGRFTMGSPVSEPERYTDEGPQHPVTLARPLAVGKFSVTFDEWDACVADGGCGGHRPADEGWGRGRRPVIDVSWNDARTYLAWLSRRTGRSYRLLSEAEREYVTRAGTTTPLWWGSTISTRQANYDGNYAYNRGPKGEYRERTVPVDSFEPNPFGLYQVHGNVLEWVEDCWNRNYRGAPADGPARMSGDCSRRVLRGGSWNFSPRGLRSAYRTGGVIGDRYNIVGFRVARTLAP